MQGLTQAQRAQTQRWAADHPTNRVGTDGRVTIKSRTQVGHVRGVFHYSDDDEKRMRVQVARIAVLYDDLMLEYDGAQEDNIPLLDRTSVNARRFYFVRRTLGTLMELKSAFVVL